MSMSSVWKSTRTIIFWPSHLQATMFSTMLSLPSASVFTQWT